MTITVARADEADLPTLVAFNRDMARETEGRALDEGVLARGVRALLVDEKKGFYLVARDGDVVVGQLMVTTEWSDWRAGVFWWIQSVYVEPSHRRRGLYARLHDEVRARAAAQGDVVGLRLYVEHENAGAQATYRRMGMTEARYVMFEEEPVSPPGARGSEA